MAKQIEEGSKAPAFNLPTDTGDKIALKDLKGQNVVLYFYPRDDTPGCTKEAIGFTEKLKDFKKLNTVVIGVSKDTVEKHAKFRQKHDLEIVLGSDADSEIVEKYGAWVEKNMYGKKRMGIERSTFLIDDKGKVNKVWRKVKVPGHVDAVLEAVKEL